MIRNHRLTQLRISPLEAIEGLLDLFVYIEQRWYQWDKLEEAIAKVKYEELSDEHLEWFVDFLANCCFRIWRTTGANNNLNGVKEVTNGFLINNYDWNAFKFGRQHELDKYTTTYNLIAIARDSLSEAEIKWLRSKCK